MAKTLKIGLFQLIVYEEHKIQKFTAKIYVQEYFKGKKNEKLCISLQLPKINHTICDCAGFRGMRGNTKLHGLHGFRAIAKFQDE